MNANVFRDPGARWRVFAAGTLLAVAAVVVYGNSFRVPFLFDDLATVLENRSIRDLWRWEEVFSSPVFATANRPLLNLTFAVNYAWSQHQVWSYHLVNLAVHILAGLALFGIVRRTLLAPNLRDRWGDAAGPLSALIAAVWTLHPLQTESVTYVSQRAESLMGLFYLLTLYCFIRSTTARRPAAWCGLSITACFCGMATKEVMVTAPLLVMLYDRAVNGNSFRQAATERRWYYLGLGLAWLFLGLVMKQGGLQMQSAGFASGVSWLTYACTELRVIPAYVKLSLWPHPLVFDYGSELLAGGLQPAAPGALLMLVLLAAVWAAWRRSAPLGFVAGAFFVLLSPTSSVVPVADQPMAENRLYLPLAALVTLIALAAQAWGGRRALVGLAVAALALGALTCRRNVDYRDAVSIWADTVAKQPTSARAHHNLAIELARLPERRSEAAAHFEQALRIDPNYAEAHTGLANELVRSPDRLQEALAHYERALQLAPGRAAEHYNLANQLAKLPGRLPDAIAHYEQALRIKPDFADAHFNLANRLGQMPGHAADAIAHYEQALRLKPDFPDAHNNLAIELAKLPGRLPEVIAHYEQALRIKPDFAEAHFNLANELAKTPGREPEAIAHYEQALRIAPGFAEAHNNLATELVNVPGRLPEAIGHFEQALQINPDYVEAHNNIAAAYAAMGLIEEAIRHLELALKINPADSVARVNLEKIRAGQK